MTDIKDIYKCDKCDKTYKQNKNLENHINKVHTNETTSDKPKQKKQSKNIFIDITYLKDPINEVIFTLKDDKTKLEDKQYVLSKIKQAHQILYEAENIEGENAMNDIMNLLFLRLIQDKLTDKKDNSKIDLFNKEYYVDKYGNTDYDDIDFKDIFKHFMIEELSTAPLNKLRSKDSMDIIKQMGSILKKHPITSQIFLEENFLKIEKSVTLQHLIKTMFIDKKTKWDVNKMYEIEDLIGEIFESFINGYTKTNSKLSQFFTPRHLMNLILDYCKKDLSKHIKNNNEYHVADFCMGTAGWLVIFYNLFKDKYGDKIKLSGGEVKPNTFQYALMNIITTTNSMPYYIQRENSLTHLDNNKYHLIITNPPFKTSFSFDNVKNNFNDDTYTKQNKIKIDDIYKLKDNNPPIQFLELCIYKLHDNGKCIIVLPYGELFFGSSYSNARDYFLKTVEITHIILVPSGVFTHTGIKTCIMIFNKDKTGTKEITFLKTNKECKELIKICSITKEDINKEPNLSLYLRDYLNDEYILELTTKMPDFEWVEFGKVFTLVKGQLQSSKVTEDENGEIIFITKCEVSEETNKKINSDTFYDSGLFIAHAFNGNGKCPIRFTNDKCIHSDLMLYCNINNDYSNKVDIKFIYYYLKSIKEHIETNYNKGSCNQSLDQKNFNRMKIPIPSMEIQLSLVTRYNLFDEQKNKINEVIMFNDKLILSQFEQLIKIEANKTNITIMKLKDIASIQIGGTPSRNVDSYWNNGNNLWVSISELNNNIIMDTNEKITDLGVKKSNVKLIKSGTILLSFKLSIGKIAIAGKDLYTNEAIAGITILDNTLINNDYLYYMLRILDIKRLGRGIMSDNGSLNTKQLEQIKIPVVNTIDKQKNIINSINKYKEINNIMYDNLKILELETKNNFLSLIKE